MKKLIVLRMPVACTDKGIEASASGPIRNI